MQVLFSMHRMAAALCCAAVDGRMAVATAGDPKPEKSLQEFADLLSYGDKHQGLYPSFQGRIEAAMKRLGAKMQHRREYAMGLV